MFYRKSIEELEKWRVSKTRKPLIIRGARQVGKTTLVNQFAKQFKQYIYINLEQQKNRLLFESDDLEQIINHIFFEKKKEKNLINETLLFIDEIQESPKVVNLLRYFKEEKPELAVIAAGSMLETLLGKSLTFPVGRVEYKVLRPVSFEEFLIATEEQQLLEELRKIPLENYAKNKLIETFHTYALIGGMPEVIQHYKENKDLTLLGPIYDALISSYLEDAEKYAKSEQQLHLLRFSIREAIIKAGHRTSYQNFGNSNYTSKAISEVLRILEKTHLLSVLHPITGTTLPIEPDYKKTPRIQFLDTGLINYFVGLQSQILGTEDLNNVYQGKLIEHLVGQELLSFQTLSLNKLHFWVRQKKQSDAEIDFIFPYKGKLIPIEVKSGAKGTLKSLQVFIDRSPLNFAVRFYARNLKIDTLETQNGKTFHLLNLPYFLVSKIEAYLEWFIKEIENKAPFENILNEEKAEYKKRKEKNQPTDIKDLNAKHLKILSLCKEKPQKGKAIIEKGLGLTYQSRNKRVYLKPLLSLGFLKYQDSENLKSKQQKYKITRKGIDYLKKHAV